MPALSAVLMDLDQTLIDSKESILQSFEESFRKELGRELPRSEVMRIYGHPLVNQMAQLAGPEAADRLVQAYREHLATLDHLITVFPEWPGVLRELRQRGYRLGIVTSKAAPAANRHLGLHSLHPLLDVVVTADDTVTHKPDPEPFLMAAARLGIAPSACLAVGDSPWDIIAAKRAGMVAALAEWGMFDSAAFTDPEARADILLPSPSDLLAICPPLSGDE